MSTICNTIKGDWIKTYKLFVDKWKILMQSDLQTTLGMDCFIQDNIHNRICADTSKNLNQRGKCI